MNLSFDSEAHFEKYIVSKMEESKECPITGMSVDMVISQAEISGYGIIDIMTIADEVVDGGVVLEPKTLNIYELKNVPINIKAIAQIARYRVGVKRLIDASLNEFLKNIEVNYFLIGPDIEKGNDTVYLSDSTPWLTTMLFDLSVDDGISFDETIGWHNANEDFSKIDKILSSRNNSGGKDNVTD